MADLGLLPPVFVICTAGARVPPPHPGFCVWLYYGLLPARAVRVG